MPAQYQAGWLLEASWEVCNKVGGIYTVLTSKLAMSKAEFEDRYLAIGPWQGDSNPLFHEEPWPERLASIPEQLLQKGVIAHYGSWLIEGNPQTILLDWSGLNDQLAHIKSLLWEAFNWDSLGTDYYDVDTPLMWSYSVGMLTEALSTPLKQIILHAHEWMSGGAILYLKQHPVETVKTVFTTHATVLGRALSSRNERLYELLERLDPEAKAREYNVVAKHQLERLSAIHATVFTTVSRLTGREASALLGRQPDVITENGIDLALFPDPEQGLASKQQSRSALLEFIAAYFYPSYRFPLQNAFLSFTMGRYETHNKGYDLYLQALGQLNQQYKAEIAAKHAGPHPPTLIALLFVPSDQSGPRPETLKQLAVFAHAKAQLLSCYTNQEQTLLEGVLDREKKMPVEDLVPQMVQEEIRRLVLPLAHPDQVPVSPFSQNNPQTDSITQLAKQYGLNNTESDPVKVVFLGAYFDGFDGLFNKPLYELIAGCDLGVFPSYYEPWGYTPMESLALLNPAITSDLAGLGIALEQRGRVQVKSDSLNQSQTADTELEESGAWLLSREGVDDQIVTDRLAEILDQSAREPKRQFLDRKLAAYQTAEQFEWDHLYENYRQAYHQTTKA